MYNFHKKTALVTGAAQGIGKAVAEKLLKNKATVIAVDKNIEKLNDFRDSLPENSAFFTYECDICDEQRVKELVSTIEEFVGEIDYLVNVAGIYRPGKLSSLTSDALNEIMNVNFKGSFYITQAVVQNMICRRRGAIVTVSSNAARTPRINMGAYPISKAALSHYMNCLGLELAEYGIRSNIVSPGSTNTAMQSGFQKDFQGGINPILQGDNSQYRLGIPLNKIAEAEDIANTVVYLLSDEAGHITLEDITVDGGATLGC